MRMRSVGFPVFSQFLVFLALAGCGGGGGSGSTGTTPPPPPPPPPPPATDQQYRVSIPTPFAVGCDNVAASGTLYINAEVEPHLAVDPAQTSHLIGAWQQDRWSNGSSRGLMSASSFDGGQTWMRTPLPMSRCGGGTFANGGDYTRASDPWVAIEPNGTAHVMGLATNGGSFQPGSVNAMLVVRSTDQGRTWSAPTTLIADGANFFNDKNTITADPLNPGTVYATWDRLVAGDAGGPTYFARTRNSGANWEPARAIYDPGSASQTLGNVIVVTPNGTLVDLFTQIDRVSANSFTSHLAVIRSFDGGTTWTPPTRIADLLSVGTRDPQSGAVVRDGSDLAQIAVAPSGHLFVVWQDSRFNQGAFDSIAISRSTDNGSTWSTPSRVSPAGLAAFTPSVTVRANGDIGVTYYDFRNNTSAASLPTDYWLARSADGGSTWTETHVATAFDLTTAPQAGGYFLGDYQGLVSHSNIFVPFFVKTNSGDFNNRTDVFAAPAVSVTVSAAAFTAQSLSPRRLRKEIAARSAPADFQPSEELRARVSAQTVRVMRQRVPGWGEVTMAPGP